MADPEIERMVAHLEASFRARKKREERAGARDLGLTLVQDLTFRELLLSAGWEALLPGRPRARVVGLGEDYAECEGYLLFPLDRLTVRRSSCPSPLQVPGSLRFRLRSLARSGAQVKALTGVGEQEGRLSGCARDCLVIGLGQGEVVVPLADLVALEVRDVG